MVNVSLTISDEYHQPLQISPVFIYIYLIILLFVHNIYIHSYKTHLNVNKGHKKVDEVKTECSPVLVGGLDNKTIQDAKKFK